MKPFLARVTQFGPYVYTYYQNVSINKTTVVARYTVEAIKKQKFLLHNVTTTGLFQAQYESQKSKRK